MVEHDLSFNIADHASKLFQSMFPDSAIARQFTCSRTKATAIVTQTLEPKQRQHVIDMMKKNPYSIMMDETTDCGTQKQTAILARYCDPATGKVESTFYDMKVQI
jgi:hypothetical protein